MGQEIIIKGQESLKHPHFCSMQMANLGILEGFKLVSHQSLAPVITAKAEEAAKRRVRTQGYHISSTDPRRQLSLLIPNEIGLRFGPRRELCPSPTLHDDPCRWILLQPEVKFSKWSGLSLEGEEKLRAVQAAALGG